MCVFAGVGNKEERGGHISITLRPRDFLFCFVQEDFQKRENLNFTRYSEISLNFPLKI